MDIKTSENFVQDKTTTSVQSAEYQQPQLIEREYIDSMLDIDCLEVVVPQMNPEVVDHNQPYNNDDIACTIFDMAGLSFGLPTSNIRAILEQQEIFSDADIGVKKNIFPGKININKEIFDVIDLHCLVMDGDANEPRCGAKVSDVILLKGCSVAISCSNVIGEKTIERSNVCWRDDASNRLWLAGTIAQLGLALLDVEGILNMLNDTASEKVRI